MTERSVKKMSPRTKRQFKEIRQEKREIILAMALEVFATHGFHGSSISMIAKHAGIAKGLIYNYFQSKEDLLKAIMHKGIQEIVNIYEPLFHKELTPALIKKFLKIYFKLLKQNTSFWQLYFSVAMQPNVTEMIEKEFGDMINPYQSLLVKYYKKQGSKNPESDALLAHSLIDGITLNYTIAHQNFPMDEVEKIVIARLEKPSF